MINSLKLKSILIENGLNQSHLAKLLNISLQSVNYKINNKRDFKITEINKICEYLHINNIEERFKIFFADNVDINLQTQCN